MMVKSEKNFDFFGQFWKLNQVTLDALGCLWLKNYNLYLLFLQFSP